ncbi:VOC family protein [Bacillus horti]|uniref:Catechol 2,3-dioxygenase-like lactoylglutathione lyase family enzyme n=1 Tax=Caldalkalibacillus horti TaxID=77523 RepID=A0ABT9VYW6_9BACI|nr:VOC family protein [Bacillus horti]MDQ0166191.1 catechol 2,3-dioxygenase-like lactoylglutathione lyase family enzyme [Bacillus horti]
MKLVFLYHPVKNLKEALVYYREVLGFEEAWREGDHTIAIHLPDSDVQVMLEHDEIENLSAGGVFLVDSVDEFFAEKKESVEFIKDPFDIPPGRYAIFKDNSGNPIRVIDFSKEKEG